MSPMNAFQILQGIETLGLRMEKHVRNTKKIVNFLNEHAAVQSIMHPELSSHPDHKIAQQLLPNGCGAVFSFEIKGGLKAGKKLIENLKVFSHLANVGDAKSLVIHPASTTHYRMSNSDLKAAGISEGTIRLSVGLEDVADLMNDLEQALKKSQK